MNGLQARPPLGTIPAATWFRDMTLSPWRGDVGPRFVAALKSVVGESRLGLHEPRFAGNEKRYLEECVDSGFVSSVGPFVSRFEHDIAEFVGAPHAVAVVNGTAGLHLALVGLGVKPGDEVLVPALSFVATASAVVLAGAIPHFVDVSEETWGISPSAMRSYLSDLLEQRGESYVNQRTGRPVTAIVPMHTLGFPVDVNGLAELAREFGLILVEDAAESLGSYSEGVHTGLTGDAGVFSFNGNKTITTGGGGAIVTADPLRAQWLKHLSTTAKVSHRYEFDHDEVGYNYRMPNINAALGVAQLEQLPELLERQRALHNMYARVFEGSRIGHKPAERKAATSNYWLQAFLLDREFADNKDVILSACLDEGIAVRPLWKPLNRLAPYRASPSARTPVADDLYSRLICLPSSPSLAG